PSPFADAEANDPDDRANESHARVIPKRTKGWGSCSEARPPTRTAFTLRQSQQATAHADAGADCDIVAEANWPDADHIIANNADVTDESHQHYSAAGHIQNGKCNRGTFVLVSDPIVSQLRNAGIEVPLPCNGPADGPPRYRISCQIY